MLMGNMMLIIELPVKDNMLFIYLFIFIIFSGTSRS
jgi:hypothetical protein